MNSSTTEVAARSIDRPEVQADIQRGIEAIQTGTKSTAHTVFQQSTARYPDVPELWVWLGGTSPNLDAAEGAFRRAQELDPNNQEAQLGLRWVAVRRQITGQVVRKVTGELPENREMWVSGSAAKAEAEAASGKSGVNFLGVEIPVAMAVASVVILVVMVLLLVWYVLS